MADYKIKFEYKAPKKGVASPVQRSAPSGSASAINNLKKGGSAPKAEGVTSSLGQNSLKDNVKTTRGLTNVIQKLINSNKKLESAINSNSRAQKKSAGSGLGGGGGGESTGAGIGRMGGALPFAGVLVGLVGFAIQQINKIGNAHIQLVSQQAKSVGIGGFQRGRGMYLSAEIGAGMKSYGMATGEFQKDRLNKRTLGPRGKLRDLSTALDVGAIYGLSADEAFQTAGQYKRATGAGTFSQTAAIGAGMGIESELNMMLQGIAGIMTDAVRDGVDTSSLSSDMAKDIGAIVQATPQKSVEAAMNIVKSFQGVQKQVASGKMGSMEGLYTTRASQSILMNKIQDQSYIEKLQKEGTISEKQASAIKGLGKDAKFEDLMKVAPTAGMYLTRKTTEETSPVALQMQVMKDVKDQYGSGAEAKQVFTDTALSQGWSLNQAQIDKVWSAQSSSSREEDIGAIMKRGTGAISKQAKAVTNSSAAMGVRQQQQRESLTLSATAAKFAKTTIAMEKSIANFAMSMDREVSALTSAIGKDGMRGATNYFSEKVKDAADTMANAIKGAVMPKGGIMDKLFGD